MSDAQFVGAVRASRTIDGLLLAETEYSSGLSIDPHPHDDPLCCFLLAGAMTEWWGHRRIECDEGRMTYLPAKEVHGQEYHADGSRCFLIQLGGRWKERMAALDVRWPTSPLDLDRSRANWIASQLYEEFASDDAAAALAIEGLTLTMLGEIARSVKRREGGVRPRWLLQAVDLLHAHSTSGISMAEIAARVDIHPTHLARTFREHYGCTMGQYVRRIRVETARDALAGTDKPISTIALDAGFSDQAHFTRTFKRLTGHTPAAWRRSNLVGRKSR